MFIPINVAMYNNVVAKLQVALGSPFRNLDTHR